MLCAAASGCGSDVSRALFPVRPAAPRHAKRTAKELKAAVKEAEGKEFPYPKGARKEGKAYSVHTPEQPEDLFPYFLLDRLSSDQISRAVQQFPPPSQAEYDEECAKLRQLGYYQYARQVALTDLVLQDLAAQDGRVQCSVCKLPFPDHFAINQHNLAKTCVHCVLLAAIKNDLPAALRELKEQSESTQDIAGGLQGVIAKVTAFNQPESPVHVR